MIGGWNRMLLTLIIMFRVTLLLLLSCTIGKITTISVLPYPKVSTNRQCNSILSPSSTLCSSSRRLLSRATIITGGLLCFHSGPPVWYVDLSHRANRSAKDSVTTSTQALLE